MTWQQWTPILGVTAFVGLFVLRIVVRRWTNRFTDKMIADTQRQTAYGARGKNMDYLMADLAKSVVFSVAADEAAAALAPSIGKPWIASGPRQWAIPVSKKDPALSEIVSLEAIAGGSRLALVRSADQVGVPRATTEWIFLRQAALKAAKAAGIDAREEPTGLPFVRVPDRDVTGLSTADLAREKFSWQRSGSAE